VISEVLLDQLTLATTILEYRNRGTLGGEVFILVEKSITSVEQTSFITDGEIEWVKVKMKNNKDLLVGSSYMPHREQKHLDELSKSLEKI
jgi:hypothetical protein